MERKVNIELEGKLGGKVVAHQWLEDSSEVDKEEQRKIVFQ